MEFFDCSMCVCVCYFFVVRKLDHQGLWNGPSAIDALKVDKNMLDYFLLIAKETTKEDQKHSMSKNQYPSFETEKGCWK